MELYLALHPPPITHSVHNATYAQLSAQLNQQMGADIFKTDSTSIATFTLDAREQSFAQIFLQMQSQHPTSLAAGFPPKVRYLFKEANSAIDDKIFEGFLASISTIPQPIKNMGKMLRGRRSPPPDPTAHSDTLRSH